jgi:nicotinamide-nucleotide amidase
MADAPVVPWPPVAVAESLTCGRVQALLGSVSGSSAYFRGGLTAYTLEQKVALLGVDRTHAAEVDCVSERVAREMAVGVRRLFHTAVGLATTGYAEASPVAPLPFAWWALAWGTDPARDAVAGRIELPGLSRTAAQEAVAAHVYRQWNTWLTTDHSPLITRQWSVMCDQCE